MKEIVVVVDQKINDINTEQTHIFSEDTKGAAFANDNDQGKLVIGKYYQPNCYEIIAVFNKDCWKHWRLREMSNQKAE